MTQSGAPQAATALLMERRKCFCVTFSKSNKNIPPQTSPLGSSLAGIWVAGEVISGRTVATWNFVEATDKSKVVVMLLL